MRTNGDYIMQLDSDFHTNFQGNMGEDKYILMPRPSGYILPTTSQPQFLQKGLSWQAEEALLVS